MCCLRPKNRRVFTCRATMISPLQSRKSSIPTGRCSKGVDLTLDRYPKLVAIDEEADHQIVHGRRLGKTYCAAHEPFNPGPQVDVLAFDGLRVLFANGMLLGIDMALIGTPSIGEKARDAERCQQLFEL